MSAISSVVFSGALMPIVAYCRLLVHRTTKPSETCLRPHTSNADTSLLHLFFCGCKKTFSPSSPGLTIPDLPIGSSLLSAGAVRVAIITVIGKETVAIVSQPGSDSGTELLRVCMFVWSLVRGFSGPRELLCAESKKVKRMTTIFESCVEHSDPNYTMIAADALRISHRLLTSQGIHHTTHDAVLKTSHWYSRVQCIRVPGQGEEVEQLIGSLMSDR